jgi:hypothetical protein
MVRNLDCVLPEHRLILGGEDGDGKCTQEQYIGLPNPSLVSRDGRRRSP